MSNSNTEDDASNSPGSDEYSDFYDLLGVPEDADQKVILKKSRKLLGKYHPDVSDHPDADKLFKTVNRAQEVLTDTEQRAIYNSLGHDQYVKRREEGGEMTLSEDIGSEGFSAATSTSNQDDTETATTDTTPTANISDDFGSSSRNERNTWAGKIREHGSYRSITEFDMGLTPRESIQKMYREIWIVRTVFAIVFGFTVLYFSFTDPNVVRSLWQAIGAPTGYQLPTIAIVLVTGFSMFVTLVSGVAAYRLLKPVADDLTIEEEEERQKRERDKERSRGLNTSVSQPSQTDSTNSSTTSSWDTHTRYDTVRDEEIVRTDKNARKNWGFKQGSRILFFGLLMTAFGSVVNGVHPWMYLQLLFGGGGVETPLWWAVGSEGVREVIVLVNAGYAFLMAAFTVGGALLTVHGLSREVWYTRYFTKKRALPFIWDPLIMVLGILGFVGVLLGTAELPNIVLSDVPASVVTYLAATDGVTSLSIALAGFTGVYALVILFRIRRRF